MIILYLIAGFLGLCLLFALLDIFFGWSDRWNYNPKTRSYLTETPEVREKNRKAVRAWLARQRGAAGASLVHPLQGNSITHGLSSGPNDIERKEMQARLARQRGTAGASLVHPLQGDSITHGLSSGPNDTGSEEDKETEWEAYEEEFDDDEWMDN